MAKIQAWAEGLTKEVYSAYKEKWSFWSHGFKIFYSPVHSKPALMIISFQPGGTEKDFEQEQRSLFQNGNFSLPQSNEYSEKKYRMAKEIRKLFDFEGGGEHLQQSVVFPLIFFRSPNIKEWRKLTRKLRLNMEEYCFEKSREIIQELKPKKVLVLGMETYDQLKNISEPFSEVRVLHRGRGKKERLVAEAKCKSFVVLAIVHPSGARIGSADRAILKDEIKSFCNEYPIVTI